MMNLVQKFIESEAQRVFGEYRQRFDKWLSTVDVDQNGKTDKQQILDDFDRIRDGLMQLVAGASDLAQLADDYYKKYGKNLIETKDPDKSPTHPPKSG